MPYVEHIPPYDKYCTKHIIIYGCRSRYAFIGELIYLKIKIIYYIDYSFITLMRPTYPAFCSFETSTSALDYFFNK